jgi:fucose 4-O-acetylase-like acetyltransferase
VERRLRPRGGRELHIDVFRGLMALIMVQGHTFDTLVQATLRASSAYQAQHVFHGSTAPGFLFASGFVAGLPRAPLSTRAAWRRAKRLIFVWGVGYALHLPFFSVWKSLLESGPAQQRALFAADALQIVALSQLVVIAVQLLVGRRWPAVTGALAVAILAAGPFVWASGVSARVHPALGSYLDMSLGSTFPIFPFSAFVLAGTVAGALVGRQEPHRRHRRAVLGGLLLMAAGALLALVLKDTVWFWGVSPGYALLRIGGLLLLLRLVEALTRRENVVVRALALLGHETLLVYVLHLYLLYGGVVGGGVLKPWAGQLEFGGAFLVLIGMIPVLLLAAWLWHTSKAMAPHRAQLALAFVTVVFVHELLVRPW